MGPIATAISNDELFLAYQPQVSADAGDIVSVETLVRWRHPTRGDLMPVNFVQAAEKSGEIEQLGAWILRRACKEAMAWSGLRTAVNVSPRQFCSPTFVPLVFDALEQSGLPPDRLEIEITESAYFEDPDRAVAELLQLRGRGIRIALDDFGTGYASLSMLRKLPLDKVKIDKSFVDALGRRDGAAIIQAVVALARALDLEVTAEGVQTEEQQRFLRASGCHYLQGYLYSQPLNADELTRLLSTPRTARPA